MKFASSLDYTKKEKFPLLIEKLPPGARKAFEEYLVWRNAPISLLDYNLVTDFIERIDQKVAGDRTEKLLCECLAHAMHHNTVIGTFRRRFDGAWWNHVPKNRDSERIRAERFEALRDSLRQRTKSGQVYSSPSTAALIYGSVHRKPGHA